jgi:putative membrane protein
VTRSHEPVDPPRPSGGGGGFADASRRTHLANERTYLAWLRTGLTAFAVAIGVGKVVPALLDDSAAAYAVAGVGFAVLGIGVVLFGLWRMLAVQAALESGRYRPAGAVALAVISIASILLGASLVALLAWGV